MWKHPGHCVRLPQKKDVELSSHRALDAFVNTAVALSPPDVRDRYIGYILLHECMVKRVKDRECARMNHSEHIRQSSHSDTNHLKATPF
mmetsp:Transcript_33195/g.82670  ORF Transcript_33195/g.82670 Transcript_33195/m.82670 type:complete len:89 (+) Transcript_33195:393-659(+)